MSTDFIALIDTSSGSVDVDWLFEQVSTNPDFGAGLIELYRPHWRIKTWRIEASLTTGEPQIWGPGGFVIRSLPRTIQMYHMMRFGMFTSDEWSRDALRRTCLLLADLVGSQRAIYTHELMPYEGEGLLQIEEGLRTRIGPPAETFEQLDNAEYYGPRAWFIDTFHDLRGS